MMQTLLRKMVVPRASLVTSQNKAFSAAAYSVKSKFEAAYNAKMEAQSKVPPKV